MNILPIQDVSALRSDGTGSNEKSYITPTSIGGAYEVQRVVHPAVAAMTQGDFYLLTDAEGTTYAVWFDIDADGTEPNGTAYTAADVKIEVDVVTGDTAALVATAADAAIGLEAGFVGFTKLKSGANIDFTAAIKGDITAPASYNESEAAGPFTVSTVSAGSLPSVSGKYFTARNTTTGFYYWFTVNGVGDDPAVADHTSKEIALVGNESQSGYLSAIATVLDTTTGMTAAVDGSRISLHVDAVGPATDISAGDSGFTVEVATQGYSQYYSPAMNLADDNPQPSAIS